MLDLQISPMQQPSRRFPNQAANLTYSKSSTRDASRILCLKLQEVPSSFGMKTKKRTAHAIAESFLRFSPRLVYRSSEETSGGRILWLFIDIASTSHLFNGEEECAREACTLAQVLGFGVQFSIADTPSGAQAFATAYPNTICPAGDERDRLKNLSLPLLLHLEGVQPWAKPSQIENILTFFLMVGFKTAGDLSKLSSASFRERWGAIGVTLWQRLNALDRAPISPLLPTEPLEDYVHLDFPISLVSLLLRHSEKSLDYLFARLSGRRLFASKLVFTFHCEYSSARHVVTIEPNTPSRNQELFTTLLENKLSQLNLENPVRDFEVHMITCEEKAAQLDFFEARVTHRDRLETLFSLLLQSSAKPGLYELQEAIMPENAWRLAEDAVVRPEDMTERRLALARGAAAAPSSVHYQSRATAQSRWATAAESARLANEQLSFGGGSFGGAPTGAVVDPSRDYASATVVAETSVAYVPVYGDGVSKAPRPSRLLAEPLPLAIEELERLKILSSMPIERLEEGWWEDRPSGSKMRDYYFAISPEGQCLWIYKDLMTDEHFLHGYFD